MCRGGEQKHMWRGGPEVAIWEVGVEEDGLYFFGEQRQRVDRGVLQGPGNLKTIFSLPLS